jgi:M6 family metalloprotease-like protein
MKKKSIFSAVVAAAVLSVSAQTLSMTSYAAMNLVGYKGDLNDDMTVDINDAVILSRHLLDIESIGADYGEKADVNNDGVVDVFDLVKIRKILTGQDEPEGIYEEQGGDETDDSDFISAPITQIYSSLPSQGTANLVIFYVDFPDCQYTYDPTEDVIEEIAFGSEDTTDSNYPFDSMTAFYSRSSKGSMNLTGTAFRYTTKEKQSAYDNDKEKLAEECYEAFKDSVDFSQFDGDGDGEIDATLFTVPTAAGDDNWWPCAGGFGDSSYTVDGMKIGHIITGNAQIESATDYYNFNSSYLHEMGHCMGLPDYYLYYSSDYEGMHGIAGSEIMDADASTDFGAFSKLMLGWYRENQVQVYDSTKGSQTFTLNNAQSDSGNCIIIPNGDLDSNYFSEYFIIEYTTEDANNSNPQWWQEMGSGIRIYHIQAEFQNDYWYPSFKYQNGNEATGYNDDGIRLIRMVNDVEGDNYFRTGDTVDSTVSGFGWYDASGNESVNPNVSISIGELSNGKYTITVTNK